MNRRFRLTSSSDFKRVRRTGSSYAHPFVILIAADNDGQPGKIGVTTARSLRRAVDRNRAKRLVREAVRKNAAKIYQGWDVVLIADVSTNTSSVPGSVTT